MIFFDLDDTLMDHSGAERAAAMHVASELGVADGLPTEKFLERWCGATATFLKQYFDGQVTFQEQRRLRMRAVLETSLGDDDADSVFEIYRRKYEEHWQLFPDVVACLNGLKSRTLGIITNGAQSQQLHKLNVLGISQFFSRVLTSESAGVAKPNPAIFRLACAGANFKPGNCIYVGDRVDMDIEPAQAAGLRAILLARRDTESAPVGTVAISSLDQLNGAIAGYLLSEGICR
jgi:putative hydrolase of the HAD superfamily